jgi:hypothetical protein
MLDIASTSTAAANGDRGLNVAISGANASSSVTRYGVYSNVTATGTSSTNVAGYFSASGATNNYGLLVPNGSIGIGTQTPADLVQVNASNATGYTPSSTTSTQPFSASDPAILISNSNITNDNNGAFLGFNVGSASTVHDQAYIGAISNSSSSGAAMVFGERNGSTSYAEAMRITPSGYVGIGTTAPSKSLQVNTTGLTASTEVLGELVSESTSGNGVALGYYVNASGTAPQEAHVRATGSIPLALGTTGSTESLYILNSGYVGVGTTAPANKLDVSGSLALGAFAGTTAEGNSLIVGGNIGIGTTYPNTNLDVLGSGSTASTEYLLSRFGSASTGAGVELGYYENAAGTGVQEGRVRSAGSVNLALGTSLYTEDLYILNSNGNVGIGTTAPTAALNIKAGTAAIAPLQLTAGTNLSTPLSGAIEYDGTNLYFTNSSATRQTLATTSSTASQTYSGDVTFSGTGTGVAVTNNETVGGTLGVTGLTTLSGGATVAANQNLTMASGTGQFSQTYSGTSGPASSITDTSAAAGDMLDIASTSTAAANGDKGLGIAISGANASSSVTRYGVYSNVTASGTSSTNVAGYFSATGGSNNYGILVPSGSVGIGTTSPSTPLDVQQSTNTSGSGFIVVASSGGNNIRVWDDGTNGRISGNASETNSILLNGGGTGYVGIGTTNPVNKLDVAGGMAIGTYAGVNTATSGNLIVSGSVGIGTNSPSLLLDVENGTNSWPATSGTTQTGTMRVGAASTNIVLDMGTTNVGTGGAWLQATNKTGLGTDYNLNLNPNGGNVGIGTSNPYGKLETFNSGLWSNLESSSNGLQTSTGHTTSDYTLYMGADATNHLSYIQSVNWGVGVAPLVLNARGGNVGIGTTTSTAKLTIAAGSTGTAPLQLTAGTNLSTPLSGAIEYDGTNLYFTNSSAARQTLATTSSTASQTYSGDVTFSGTGTGVAVTNNETVGGTLGVTGLTTLSGGATVAANQNLTMSSGTGKFSQTFSGTSGPASSITDTSAAAGDMLDIASTSTAAVNGDKGISVAISGANASSSVTRYGVYSKVTSTGTSSTNVAGYFSASGAGTNYGLLVPSGNVGVGTTAPAAALDVYGGIDISGNNAISFPSGDSTVGGSIGIGVQALNTETAAGSASYGNTAVGYQAIGGGTMTTAAVNNTAVGNQALSLVTSGNNNTALGFQAGQGVTSGSYNMLMGGYAGANLGSGGNNMLFGMNAGGSNVGGNGLVAIGSNALSNGTSGSYDVAIGGSALGNTTASNLTAIGQNSQLYTTTGGQNTSIGNAAMEGTSGNGLTGSGNTAIGDAALTVIQTTAASNTVIGAAAGNKITTGSSNTVIGRSVASTTLTTGTGNILIGTSSGVDTPAAGTTNFLDIGNVIFATGMSGSVTAPAGNVGIGTTAPSSALEVSGGSIVSDSVGNTVAYINAAKGNVQVSSVNATTINLCGVKDGGAYTLILTGLTAGATITVNGYSTYTNTTTCTGSLTVDLGAGATTFVSAGHTNILSFIYTTKTSNGNTLFGSVSTNFNVQ